MSQLRKDNPLLDQAMDAFKQASRLEKSLKRSEEAVSQQTKELKRELSKAKATAKRTGQVSKLPLQFFRERSSQHGISFFILVTENRKTYP
jgi:hypothetical protein